MPAPVPRTAVLALHLNHGTLGVARSLGRLGIPVYVMGEEPDGAVASSRYVRNAFAWSFAEASDEESVRELLDVGARLGDRVLLIAGTDDLALLLAEHADRLESRFAFPRHSPSLVSSLIDKSSLHHLLRSHGIPTPRTVFPATLDEAVSMARGLDFPVMLKGIDGLRLQARTGIKMVRVDSDHELETAYRALEDPVAPNLMLQEYIPGDDDSVWMFNGYFDATSRCLMGTTGQKIHQYPPHRGATSLGAVRENTRVRALTLRFAESIGYRGILDIGFRYDARDDTYKLLDPNPRIGCTFRLFVDRGGLDVARALYQDLTGEPVSSGAPAEGRKWVVEDAEVESVLYYLRHGEITLGRWLRDLRGVRELAWWALDDPLPALRRAIHHAPRVLRWLGRRLRGVPPAREPDAPTPPSTGSRRTAGVGSPR